MKISRLISACVIAIVMLSIYFVGYKDGMHDEESQLLPSAQAAGGGAVQTGWSPTKPYPTHEVYYPGTEELGSDEMRVIACGTGMPMPRLKQAAACFVIELGNGDKFIFDMGNGSFERIHALGIPMDYLDKVFITHPHMDHMADLATF
ncbi:MAG: MBL fold metallo-hydrolase, partial [Gammaproteobacteria bacterium]